MNCECNNKSNRVKPGIKHVYGNVLRMAIPLTLRTLVKDGDEMVVTDTDFIPSSDHPVRVVFSKGKTNYPIIATMDGNVAIVEDKGKIPVGTYDISVECYDDLGNPYRFKQNAVLYVADTTAEAGIDEEIEYEAQTWYLNAAVFLATTEIGEIGDVIDAKLDDVFGNVAYDADAKEIRFYNKGNSKVLATIDSSPFIADGTVADVYIDVSRQVLVVVLNEDAGGTRFSVPLYLIFNSYYKKDEVDSLVSSTVEGMRFDFSQELPLVVHVTKNGSSYSSPVDFGMIENAIREDGRLVVACVNNDIFYQLLVADRAEIAFSRVVALDGYQELLIVDTHNVWSMEDVDLGTGGGGGYEPPAGGIPKTDLAPAVQASLDKADAALQQSDLSGYATQEDVDDAVAALVSSAPQTLDTLKELADALGDDPNFATTMATQLDNKVDKETGKGLSTNDYTTAEKQKLAGLENYDDSALQTAVAGKVDKESGKSLMTDAERTKLQGIAAGAEVNVQPNWTQTNTSADDYIKNKPDLSTFATKTELNAKQDKINDLATIRSGAAKGATSVQTVSVNGASLSPTDGNISISAVTGLQFDGSLHVGAVQLPEYVKKSVYDTTIEDIYQSIPSDLADMADDATHRVVTDAEKSTWSGKQDAISDLATIRSGAAAGATALQSYTETDPTVPAWAKASTKPSYTASEVGAVPTIRTVNGKALSSDVTIGMEDIQGLETAIGEAGKVKSVTINGVTPPVDNNGNINLGTIHDGVDGDDGITPHIGQNGYWYIGTTNTGVKAQGERGNDGVASADECVVVNNLDGEPDNLPQGKVAVLGAEIGGTIGDRLDEIDASLNDVFGGEVNVVVNGNRVTLEIGASASEPRLIINAYGTAFMDTELNTSKVKHFTLTGRKLTAGASISIASSNSAFLLSADGTNYLPTITINAGSDGKVSQVVYVKFTPTSETSYSATITATCGTASATTSYQGTGAAEAEPSIVLQSNLDTITTDAVGNPATLQFVVYGYNLNAPIALSASVDSGSTAALDINSVSATDAENGKVVTLTFTPGDATDDTITITATSSGATTQTLAITGKVVLPPAVDDTFEVEGINYKVTTAATRSTSGNVQVIAKSSGKYSGEVIIPNTISKDGYQFNVTSIASSTFRESNVTRLTIGDNITSFGGGAWQYKLVYFKGGTGLTSIGAYGLHKCTALATVVLESGVTSIGDGAFDQSSAISSFTCKATTPPSASDSSFPTLSSATLYVPSASVSAYQSATGWSKFGNITAITE